MRVNYAELVPTSKLVRRVWENDLNSHLLVTNTYGRTRIFFFMCCVCGTIFREAEGYKRTSYRFCNLWTPDSIDPTHQPEAGPLIRIQFTSWPMWRKLARELWDWMPSHEYLIATNHLRQRFHRGGGGVGNRLLRVLEGGALFQTMQTHIPVSLSSSHLSIHLHV